MTFVFKLVLAALLLLRLADMPPSFYLFTGIACGLLFIYLAIASIVNRNYVLAAVWALLAGLYQPFLELPISRDTWSILLIATAAWLLVSLVLDELQARREENQAVKAHEAKRPQPKESRYEVVDGKVKERR
jgi:hypothetical protein